MQRHDEAGPSAAGAAGNGGSESAAQAAAQAVAAMAAAAPQLLAAAVSNPMGTPYSQMLHGLICRSVRDVLGAQLPQVLLDWCRLGSLGLGGMVLMSVADQ